MGEECFALTLVPAASILYNVTNNCEVNVDKLDNG